MHVAMVCVCLCVSACLCVCEYVCACECVYVECPAYVCVNVYACVLCQTSASMMHSQRPRNINWTQATLITLLHKTYMGIYYIQRLWSFQPYSTHVRVTSR